MTNLGVPLIMFKRLQAASFISLDANVAKRRSCMISNSNERCTCIPTLPRCVCCLSLSSSCVLCCCCRRCVWSAWGLWGRGSERALLRGLCDWAPPADRWSNGCANWSGTESRPWTAKRQGDKEEIHLRESKDIRSNKMKRKKSYSNEAHKKGERLKIVWKSTKVHSQCNHQVVL